MSRATILDLGMILRGMNSSSEDRFKSHSMLDWAIGLYFPMDRPEFYRHSRAADVAKEVG